jgi:hypothetical protein
MHQHSVDYLHSHQFCFDVKNETFSIVFFVSLFLAPSLYYSCIVHMQVMPCPQCLGKNGSVYLWPV